MIVRKILILIVSSFVLIAAGSYAIYPLYVNSMAKRFNFTSGQINLFSSFIDFGYFIALPMGFIYDKFGHKISLIISAILIPGCYYLLNLLMTAEPGTHGLFPFLVVGFMLGQGSILAKLTTISVNLKNFKFKESSAMVGLLLSNLAISASIFSSYKKEALPLMTIESFFNYMAMFIFVVLILAWLFFNSYDNEKEQETSEFDKFKEKKMIVILIWFNLLILLLYILGLLINNITGSTKIPNFLIFPILKTLNFVVVVLEIYHYWDEDIFRKYIEKQTLKQQIKWAKALKLNNNNNITNMNTNVTQQVNILESVNKDKILIIDSNNTCELQMTTNKQENNISKNIISDLKDSSSVDDKFPKEKGINNDQLFFTNRDIACNNNALNKITHFITNQVNKMDDDTISDIESIKDDENISKIEYIGKRQRNFLDDANELAKADLKSEFEFDIEKQNKRHKNKNIIKKSVLDEDYDESNINNISHNNTNNKEQQTAVVVKKEKANNFDYNDDDVNIRKIESNDKLKIKKYSKSSHDLPLYIEDSDFSILEISDNNISQIIQSDDPFTKPILTEEQIRVQNKLDKEDKEIEAIRQEEVLIKNNAINEMNLNSKQKEEVSFSDILKTSSVWILFCIQFLCEGIIMSNLNNISYIYKSMADDDESEESINNAVYDYVIIFFIFNSVARLIVGLVISKYIKQNNFYWCMVIFCMLLLTSQVIGLFLNKGLLFITISLLGVVQAGLTTFTTMFVRIEYGLKSLGKLLGLLYIGNACGTLIICNFLFITLYKINTHGDLHCKGKHCFFISFIINSSLAFISLILSLVLYDWFKKKYFKNNKNAHNIKDYITNVIIKDNIKIIKNLNLKDGAVDLNENKNYKKQVKEGLINPENKETNCNANNIAIVNNINKEIDDNSSVNNTSINISYSNNNNLKSKLIDGNNNHKENKLMESNEFFIKKSSNSGSDNVNYDNSNSTKNYNEKSKKTGAIGFNEDKNINEEDKHCDIEILDNEKNIDRSYSQNNNIYESSNEVNGAERNKIIKEDPENIINEEYTNNNIENDIDDITNTIDNKNAEVKGEITLDNENDFKNNNVDQKNNECKENEN